MDVGDWVGLGGLALGVIGLIVTYLLNERAKRREARRRVWIDFLTDAYRKLEHASNREPTPASAVGMEEALRDVMLFGSDRLIQLARSCIDTFVADRSVDTNPILQELRTELRKELLLPATTEQPKFLRFDPGGPAGSSEAWAHWKAQVVRTIEGTATLDGGGILSARGTREPSADQAALLRTITDLHETVLSFVREQLDSNGTPVEDADGRELAHAAFMQGLITDASRNAVEGLTVMRTLARQDADRGRLSQDKVTDYSELAEAVLYTLKQPQR